MFRTKYKNVINLIKQKCSLLKQMLIILLNIIAQIILLYNIINLFLFSFENVRIGIIKVCIDNLIIIKLIQIIKLRENRKCN